MQRVLLVACSGPRAFVFDCRRNFNACEVQVQRPGQRYEADAQMLEFQHCGEQIGDRSSPAVQPPHQNDIDLPAPRSFRQLLPQLALGRSAEREQSHRSHYGRHGGI